MTQQDVLDALAADTATEWELVDGGKIRTGCGDGPAEWHCPLSHLAGTAPCIVGSAAVRLGLSEDDAGALAAAADYESLKNLRSLRSDLLRACRLEAHP